LYSLGNEQNFCCLLILYVRDENIDYNLRFKLTI
jgi:hypothetical protein